MDRTTFILPDPYDIIRTDKSEGSRPNAKARRDDTNTGATEVYLTGCIHVNVKACHPLLFLRKHFLSDVLRDDSGRRPLRAPDATSLNRKVVEGAGQRKVCTLDPCQPTYSEQG